METRKENTLKQTRIRNYLALFTIVFLGFTWFYLQHFSFTDYGAIKKYTFGTKGNILYEQQYEGKNVIVIEGATYNSVYVVKSYLKLLNRVIDSSSLVQSDPSIPLLRTWGGSLNNNKLYDTLIAVQSVDKEIVKIIVSNEIVYDEFSNDMDYIMANSTFFEELPIIDDFAIYYNQLEPNLVGSYIFRGLNEQGEIIAVLR